MLARAVPLLLQVLSCPARAGAAIDSAWRDYRDGRLVQAAARFAGADSLCPGLPDVRVGLGFVAVRRGATTPAQRHFLAALRADSLNADAWYGLGLVRARRHERDAAAEAFRRVLAIAPHYTDAEQQLLALGGESAALHPIPRPATAQVPARTTDEHFETLDRGVWRPFYVKGINLGAARPGFFPSEFPVDDSTYQYWIRLIAEAHANVVRLYTIFPPAFYRALKQWNDAHPERALWLVHGVWAEAPPGNDYDARGWKEEFRVEMRRVVDLLHGNALIPGRPGHAFGRYSADVSDHVLAFIIGREWEPFTIRHYNEQHARHTAYRGRFLVVDSGTPADVWMAQQCDYLMSYEWDTFHAQRPVAYTNWPTLDPLSHPTEPTLEEEAVLRRRLGLPKMRKVREYNNDDQSLDAMRVRVTPQNAAGYFAAYHVYPYYPDFIDYDSLYGTARSADGPSHYLGYLRDLKRHHAGRPLLIAEYGVPSSRGLGHLQPEGMHHGGHDERAMAAIDARLTREIREAGLAGSILFAWLDEWFKHNWVVIDLEVPAERNRLWWSPMDAEQHYGLLGQYAGDAGRGPELGGDPARWRTLAPQQGNDTLRLHVGSDEAYLYLGLEAPLGDTRPVARLLVGIDTYRSDRGAFRLPGVPGRLDAGIEFLLDLPLGDTTGGRLFVTRSYNPYLGPRPGMGPTDLDPFENESCTVDVRDTVGAFDSLFVTTNRFRVARNGRVFPARGVNRGKLRYGRQAQSTLADWFVDRAARLVEVRLPWGLLNVTDPSSRTVLRAVGKEDVVSTAETDGFRFVVAALSGAPARVVARLRAGATYAWPKWEQPKWHERLKPAYFTMRDLWRSW